MIGAALAVALVAIVLVRVDRVVARRDATRQTLEQRRVDAELTAKARALDLEERALALREQEARRLELASTPLPRLDEFPPPLRRMAERESEAWMRDDVIRIVQEEYVASGADWNKAAVRIFARFRTPTDGDQAVS